MTEYSFVRYLCAKTTVDDRALNRHVMDELAQSLQAFQLDRPRVLELGAGVGTMVSRLADRKILRRADYTLLDQDGAALAAARSHLETWQRKETIADGKRLRFQDADHDLSVAFECATLQEYLRRTDTRASYDVIVANAVLDLLDLNATMPLILGALKAGRLFWFSVNFDGLTSFLPEHASDAKVMQIYHRSMDNRIIDGKPSGDSCTGRHLIEYLLKRGASLIAAGSSDWVVFPTKHGYPADEAYFLRYIIATIDQALAESDQMDAATRRAWTDTRLTQIDRGKLVYIAHQLDVVGSMEASG